MTWWESWFGEEYLDLYPHRDVDSARREVAFALAQLPGTRAPLLDLCCGSGRHSVPFAEAGVPPVGLDYSAPLLDLARRRHPRLRPRARRHAVPALSGRHLRRRRQLLHELRLLPARVGKRRRRRRDRTRAPPREARFSATRSPATGSSRGSSPRSTDRCGEKEYTIRRSWNPDSQRIEKEIEVRREGSTEIFRESVRAYARGRARRALLPRGAAGGSDVGRLRRIARRRRIRPG